MNSIKKNYLLCVVLLIFIACGGGLLGKKPIYPAKVEPAMETAFAVPERDYKSHQYLGALEGYRKFIDTFPHTALTDEAHYKIGKIYFLQQKFDQSGLEFQTLATKTPDPQYRSKAYLMAGYAAYKQGAYQQSAQLLNQVEESSLDDKLLIRFYSLQILDANQVVLPTVKTDYAMLKLVDLYNGPLQESIAGLQVADLVTKRQVMQLLDSWMISPLTLGNIPSWFADYPMGFARGYVEYKWAKTYFEAGESARAERQLVRFVKLFPKHEYVSSAQKMIEELGGKVVVKKISGALRIGVLLPLSGPTAPFGDAVLRGIKCGSAEVNGCAFTNQVPGSPPIELIVRNTSGGAEEIIDHINGLIRDDVSAIIGPMTAELAQIAAQRVGSAHIPLFPITQMSGMEGGDYIFQMGYDAAQQIRDIVTKARARGIKTFGLFYPENNYGKRMAELFRREVEVQGGKIAADASFDPQKLDLASQVRTLKLGVKRFSYSSRSAGFEALFIPDSYRMIQRLAPVLQFVTIRDIPLLGTNAWHDENFSGDVFKSFPDSFFVDVFHEAGEGELARQFVQGFQTSFAKHPNSLEALGFDAVWFVRQAARKSRSTKPSAIKAALLTMQNLDGVTAIQSFASGKGPTIRPYYLTVGEEGVVLAK